MTLTWGSSSLQDVPARGEILGVLLGPEIRFSPRRKWAPAGLQTAGPHNHQGGGGAPFPPSPCIRPCKY